MTAPRATYRLQLHRSFTFEDAAHVVPYLAALGVSHVYASPIMTAQAGSMHGYDVVDPSVVNPELGGEDGLKHLVAALRSHDMGLIVDIVPNHMAANSANAWWMQVLAHGRQSCFAKYFDINWDPPDTSLKDKILLPILGRPYGEVLEAGELEVIQKGKDFLLHYFDHVLPLAVGQERIDLAQINQKSSAGKARLHSLLQQQNYRLSWWRSANDSINWRRFFDINTLVALRVEDDEVFSAVHANFFRLYEESLIDGVRVDHIDGLSEPGNYCRKLRAHLHALEKKRSVHKGPAYFVVEKILARGESLPLNWQTDGTTGYDFMGTISALLHDPHAEHELAALWHRISGRPETISVEEQIARRQILMQSFSAQFGSLIKSLSAIAESSLETRDYSSSAIYRSLTEILVHLTVYRTYARVNETSETDRSFLSRAVKRATATALRSDRWMMPILERWLSGDRIGPEFDSLQNEALARFQQLSAPLCAKAVEDTAFYRYGRLLSRNDVGFDAATFSCSVSDFHESMQSRFAHYPNAMLATATHDHKRGEDVRARLAVLSEIPNEWSAALDRWVRASVDNSGRNKAGPTAGDMVMLFQNIVGAWPLDLEISETAKLQEFRKRIAAWQLKALREAKLESDWSEPNSEYESATENYIEWLFSSSTILQDIKTFATRISAAGAVNGLAQVLIKLTAPGVPDTYQGCELWDLSLVDPDNRRPINFALRQKQLGHLTETDLLVDWRSGQIKLALISYILAARAETPEVFSDGQYVPIPVSGSLQNHILAFARIHHDKAAITIAPRLLAAYIKDDKLSFHLTDVQETKLLIPNMLRRKYRSAISSAEIPISNEVSVGEILQNWPVGLLISAAPTDNM